VEIHFYPWDKWSEYRSVLVQAKQATGYTEKVTPSEAKPGSMRVIAVEVPPFLCDYALVKSGTVGGFTAALKWYFGLSNDPRVVTVEKMLSKIMGGEVFEHLEERDYGERLINPTPEPASPVKSRSGETNRDRVGSLW
jgi:hypothetical protein